MLTTFSYNEILYSALYGQLKCYPEWGFLYFSSMNYRHEILGPVSISRQDS